MTEPGPDLLARARERLLPVVIVVAIGVFASTVHFHYPIQKWLFWRYAGYWLLCGIWSFACVGAGHLTVRRLLGRGALPFLEHLATSFAVGVFEFFLGMYLLGLCRLYHPAAFVVLPAAMAAVSARPLITMLRRYARHARHASRTAPRRSLGWYVVVALGVVGLAMVYFLILTPENVQFDSRWKHLALAEDYVASGGMRRFPEGWTVATYPHLSSFLYTWAFLLPGGGLFDHVELAAHIEFTGFLWTLVGVSALVRRLVPRAPAELAWVARFLFPGVFLYDSTLSVGADHVAAIFVVPLYTMLLRACRRLDAPSAVLLATMSAGAILVKYTSMLMLLPIPATALVVRVAMVAADKLRGRPVTGVPKRFWLAPLVALGAGLVLTAPHWVKNWIWYGDPIYPNLHATLHLRPWNVDAADLFEWGYKDHQFWRPTRDLAGVGRTIAALGNFSFLPNDWVKFHGHVPVFGSLMTLLLMTLPLFPWARKGPVLSAGTRRLWGLAACIHAAIAVWYWTHHQDRYLQTILPWMAAFTAAMLLLGYRSGTAARWALGVLVALQIVWGGDVYFIQTHAMIRSPIKEVVDLLSAGYRKEYEERLHPFGRWSKMGEALPKGARVVLHDEHVHLGLGASSISDWGGWQFGISYGRLRSPRALYDLYRGMGATHIIWDEQVSKGWDSLAGDITFFDFALRRARTLTRYGRSILAQLPEQAPPEGTLDVAVAYLGCNDTYATGLYPLAAMTVPVFGPESANYPAPLRPGPPRGDPLDQLVRSAEYVVLDPACLPTLPPRVAGGFVLVAKRRLVRDKRKKVFLEIWTRAAGVQPVADAGTAAPAGDDDETPGEFQ